MKKKYLPILVVMLVIAGLLILIVNGTYAKVAPEEGWNKTFGRLDRDYGYSAQGVHNLNTGKNFSTIQAAIDAADTLDGHTITVDPDTYYECVNIYKSLTIRSTYGNPGSTTVRAKYANNHVFEVTADYVNISGFTLKGTGGCGWWAGVCLDGVEHCNITNNNMSNNNCGINLNSSSNNIFTGNNVNSNSYGIKFDSSSNNIFTGNNVSLNHYGIWVYYSSNNAFVGNNVLNNDDGVYLYYYSSNNIFTENNISNYDDGIWLYYSSNNTFVRNNISNNSDKGIHLLHSSDNIIFLNNFMNNSNNAYSSNSSNIWNSISKITYTHNSSTYTNYLGNYWDDYKGSDKNSNGTGDVPYDIYEPYSVGEKDDFDYYPLIEPWEIYFGQPPTNIFDTRAPANPYPSIMGNHTGTITPSYNISVSKLYTYPCEGTGGHTNYAKIWNNTGWNATATWNGYAGDWQNISFNKTFTLYENETYNYTIRTGSYPQIIHESPFNATGGTITCNKFIDANGKIYNNWIPAIRLR